MTVRFEGIVHDATCLVSIMLDQYMLCHYNLCQEWPFISYNLNCNVTVNKTVGCL